MLRKLKILQTLGPGWALYRAGYALRRKSGLLKRGLTTQPLEQLALGGFLRTGVPSDPAAYRAWRREHGGRFFFEPGKLPAATLLGEIAGQRGRDETIRIANDYRAGRFLYYSRHVHDLGTSDDASTKARGANSMRPSAPAEGGRYRPVDWLLNPINGGRHNNATHWCDYPTFSRELGDIKDVWEPSRFALAFWLVRAYALTGDSAVVQDYWRLFDSWTRQNPPNMGPNWKCGQETAIRCFGMCFALYAFCDDASTSDRHVVDMAKLMAVSAERIEKNIDYAYSQKNNHGMSEAIGLLTIGLLFPEFQRSAHWAAKGRDYLEREIARQIYDDGSFVQHSMNYHRVMLHDCLWAARLAELNGQPLSRAALDRIDQAGVFLYAMLDHASGGVPNHGSNDGANILPLAACDYTDFRPTVQAARFRATGRRVLPSGPWDEMLVWLFGAESCASTDVPHARTGGRAASGTLSASGTFFAGGAPAAVGTRPNGGVDSTDQVAQRFDAGGYYTLHHGDAWGMIRCHTYRDRPAHLDMLHLDLWHRGVNVLSDSGTYRYYTPDEPAAEKYFKGIAAHNTVQIDGRDPLDLVSRFLWMPWPRAKCIEHSADRFQGEHYAYDRSPWRVIHRRTVDASSAATWIVTDELLGGGEHDVALHWHLVDGESDFDPKRRSLTLRHTAGCVRLDLTAPDHAQLSLSRGESDPTCMSGWESRYYQEKAPRPTLTVRVRARLPLTLTTRITLAS